MLTILICLHLNYFIQTIQLNVKLIEWLLPDVHMTSGFLYLQTNRFSKNAR